MVDTCCLHLLPSSAPGSGGPDRVAAVGTGTGEWCAEKSTAGGHKGPNPAHLLSRPYATQDGIEKPTRESGS